jgi:hypothetical protein
MTQLGSMVVSALLMQRISSVNEFQWWLANSIVHTSYLPGPARTYNLTCDHQRRILYSTNGHPAHYNNKSLIRFDQFANKLKNGEIFEDRVFELQYRKSIRHTSCRGHTCGSHAHCHRMDRFPLNPSIPSHMR